MGAVLFFHLTRSPLEQTVRTLLARALGQGWRVVVRSPDAGRLDQLDTALWLGPEDEFLPHGRAGGAHDADQPILLTDRSDRPNAAVAAMILDDAGFDHDEGRSLERVWVLFDGADPAAVEAARGRWRDVTGAGLAAQYWSEESGRWEKKMERAPAAP